MIDPSKDNIEKNAIIYRAMPESFNKNGFTYELIMRDGDIAMYKQRLRPGAGCLAYEVMKIKKSPAGVIMGREVEARETGASNEDFGFSAWSYPTLDRAKAKMRELVANAEFKSL